MQQAIFILEDNDDRIAAMRECLSDKFPFFELHFARSASEATVWLGANLNRTICVCLDHDLERPLSQPDAPDPGTGREVADSLAARSPTCPVIIHTTNSHAALGMELELQDAGWEVQRILPFGDLEWISTAWLPLVRGAVVGRARGEVQPHSAAMPLALGQVAAHQPATHEPQS